MADAKTNVTSDEIQKETILIKMDVDVDTEDIKKVEDEKREILKTESKMEEKTVEFISNGDKFNHMNHSYNVKEENGTANAEELNWFSILPRETCNTPGPSTKQIFGVAEPTELKIPIFPPPASPGCLPKFHADL